MARKKATPAVRTLAQIQARALKTIPVVRRVSCLAFTHPERTRWGGVPTLRRETLRVGGKDFRLVSFRGGEWEVYRVEPDGMEMFVGYAPDALAAIAKGRAA